MNGRILLQALVGTSLLGFAAQAGAQSRSQTFLDVQAGLGYSSNPELLINGDGSAFGRISAFGYHGWSTERSYTGLSAYVENSTYFRSYGNRPLFNLRADTSLKASETVNLTGNLGLSADFGGQLSSRFYSIPSVVNPDIPPPAVDVPVIVVSPDLAAFNRRQYRLTGGVGASVILSPRDTFTTSFGAQRAFSSGNSQNLDYSQFDASAGYQRQITERSTLGVRAIGSYATYGDDRSILSYGPQITGTTQLSQNTVLSGAVGFVRTEQDLGAVGGKNSSTDLALDASLCRSFEFENLCIQAGRRSQSSVSGAAPISSNLTASYFRRLNARDQIQASVGFVSTGRVREFNNGRSTFFTAATSFDRKVNDRVSAGVNVAARKLSNLGPDPKMDFSGSIFIRNRFGSIR